MYENLTQIALNKGFSQYQIAKELDISACHVSLLFNGKRTMSLEMAYILAVMLDITMDQVHGAIYPERHLKHEKEAGAAH